MGLITGLCFSTVFLALDVEVDGGPFYHMPSAPNELGLTQGGGQVEHEAMERNGNAQKTVTEALHVC